MSNIQTQLVEIVELIDTAERIFESSVNWQMKYQLIMALDIHEKIEKAQLTVDYCCVDGTFEADTTSYVRAMTEFRDQIKESGVIRQSGPIS